MLRLYNMRKFISSHFSPSSGWAVIACLLLLLLFSACSTSQTPSSNVSTVGGTASTPTTSSNTNGSSSSATTGSVVPLNIAITYASIEITIADVKQAKTFSDDTSVSSSNILRLDLKENNPTSSTAYSDYSEISHLLSPDGTKVAPLATQANGSSIDASSTLNTWIDFPASPGTNVSQLTLQLGKDTEAQELIPLTANADVSKYVAKTTNPNGKMAYGTIDWTVTTATSELSYGAKQADKGMMFVVLELNANNNGSSGGGGDLVQVRLKSGDTTSPAQEFLNSVAGNQTNVKSTVSFIMPQGSTSFSLIFLPSNAYGITTQSSVDFQIA